MVVDAEYALDVQDHRFKDRYHVPYTGALLEVTQVKPLNQ